MHMAGHDDINRQAVEFNTLDVRAPLTWGMATAALALIAGASVAALVPAERGVMMAARPVALAAIESIRAPRNGTVSEISVVEGQTVRAGDVLVSFDTRVLDEQIAALKAQSEAAGRQLELTRLEAVTVGDLLKRKLATKANVVALEQQVAALDREITSFNARIAVAEQELQRSSLRAPADGRVVSVRVSATGDVVQTGTTLLELQPQPQSVVLEGRLRAEDVEHVHVGMAARLMFPVKGWPGRVIRTGRLSWLSGTAASDGKTGEAFITVRVEAGEIGSELGGALFTASEPSIQVAFPAGDGTLLQSLIDLVAVTSRVATRT
jgi:RND family efflux transporter MFP subunit